MDINDMKPIPNFKGYYLADNGKIYKQEVKEIKPISTKSDYAKFSMKDSRGKHTQISYIKIVNSVLNPPTKGAKRKLSDEQIESAKVRYANGESQPSIARDYGVAVETLRKYCKFPLRVLSKDPTDVRKRELVAKRKKVLDGLSDEAFQHANDLFKKCTGMIEDNVE